MRSAAAVKPLQKLINNGNPVHLTDCIWYCRSVLQEWCESVKSNIMYNYTCWHLPNCGSFSTAADLSVFLFFSPPYEYKWIHHSVRLPVYLPDFTFFNMSCKLFHKLFSFHPVDDGPPVLSTVAKKCFAVQTERHTCKNKIQLCTNNTYKQ